MKRRNFIKSLGVGSLIGLLPDQAKPLRLFFEPPDSTFINQGISGTAGFSKSWVSPDHTFASLEIGESNHSSHAIARMVVSEIMGNRRALHSPFVLQGDEGIGRTHVVHAIANEVLQQAPEMAVHSVHAVDLIDGVRRAYRNNSIAVFCHIYQDLDLLCLDDVHRLSGDLRAQQMLCQIIDTLVDSNSHIVMSSAPRLDEIAAIDDGLISRLGRGVCTTIRIPDFQMRVRILKREAKKENIFLEDEVARFIVNAVEDSNARVIFGALKKLIAFSRYYGCSVSVNTACTALHMP